MAPAVQHGSNPPEATDFGPASPLLSAQNSFYATKLLHWVPASQSEARGLAVSAISAESQSRGRPSSQNPNFNRIHR